MDDPVDFALGRSRFAGIAQARMSAATRPIPPANWLLLPTHDRTFTGSTRHKHGY
jgi:hypothetical protein